MRKFFYLFAFMMAGILVGGKAYAQCPDLPSIGDTYICYFVNGGKVVVLPGGPAPTNSSGQAVVHVTGLQYNPCQVIFEVDQFSSNGAGEIGTIDANLVPTSQPTTLTGAPGSGTLFPAELDLNINLQATGSALGGQTYLSNGPLNLRASNVNSLPLQGVNVQQTHPLDFVAEDGSNGFVLEKTDVVLNP